MTIEAQQQIGIDFVARARCEPFNRQLLKWVGNKQRFAHEIASYFPAEYNLYIEPFLGSASVLATLAPHSALASDAFAPLIQIFSTLRKEPETLKRWYTERWQTAHGDNKVAGYESIKSQYNQSPNGADLLFLCRACYGGVVRFRKSDGYMSTPCGAHEPMPPANFNLRVDDWHNRVRNTDFAELDYREAMATAKRNDLIYCDPPYKHSQAILYGGQDFRLEELFEEIDRCKTRGVRVALSIDGIKKTDQAATDLSLPDGLFERELYVNVGRSMLKRFQMQGKSLEAHQVADRLLLTY